MTSTLWVNIFFLKLFITIHQQSKIGHTDVSEEFITDIRTKSRIISKCWVVWGATHFKRRHHKPNGQLQTEVWRDTVTSFKFSLGNPLSLPLECIVHFMLIYAIIYSSLIHGLQRLTFASQLAVGICLFWVDTLRTRLCFRRYQDTYPLGIHPPNIHLLPLPPRTFTP